MRRILVVGYPKSGNTWATRMTAELLSAPTTSRSARARSRAACARLLQHLGVQRSAERVRTAIARQSLAAAKQRFEMRGDRRRASFLREGSSGAWVTALTAEQHALCARRFAPILERLGYADPRAPIPSPVAVG